MTEREVSFKEAYKQAEKEIPEKWYEHTLSPYAMFIGVSVLSTWMNIFSSGSSYAPNLIGGALYGISSIADQATTMELTSVQDKGAERGFPRKTHEGNIFLRNVVTVDDFRSARNKVLAIEGLGVALSALFPDIGAGLAAGKLTCAASSRRITARYSRAVEIATK